MHSFFTHERGPATQRMSGSRQCHETCLSHQRSLDYASAPALVADREVDDRCSNEQRADSASAAELLAEQADCAEQSEHGYEIEHDRRPAGVDAGEPPVVDQETEREPDRADGDGHEPIPRGGG